MKKALIPLLVLASFVLGATVFREQVARAAAGIQPVFVTNSTREPVPVHEQGTADVNVTNATLAVRAAGETPTQGLLQLKSDCPVNPNFQCFTAQASYTVPAGKRLLIKFVTFHDAGNASSITAFWVRATVDGTTANHFLSSSPQGVTGEVVSESVEIYADPGSEVRFNVGFTGSIVGKVMDGSFSGVLIDAP